MLTFFFSIADSVRFLSSNKEDPYGSSKSIMGKSISLRFLIHNFGDVHQPLHAAERVTPNRPGGDMGGNLFTIKHYNNTGMDNLHFIWDEMFDDYKTSIRSNLNATQYQFIEQLSLDIQQEYTFDLLKNQITKNSTQKLWSQESLDVAVNFAYKNIQEGQDLPEAYQQQGRDICRNRVALAGYRLGVTLDKIYKQINSKESSVLSKYLSDLTQFSTISKKTSVSKSASKRKSVKALVTN